VKIGARTFVGAGAALKHGVNLGKDVVVASGANVTQDFKEPAVVASLSSPASVLRERKEGDDYL